MMIVNLKTPPRGLCSRCAGAVSPPHRQAADVDPTKRTGLLLDKEIIADLNATIAQLKTLRVQAAPLGIVRFCMGGRVS